MIKLITIIGARPQIIKAAAISRAIKQYYSSKIKEIIVHTGQHYDSNLSDIFIDELRIPKPDYNLNIGSGSHGKQTAGMIEGIEGILVKENPSYILLYGDTNSTLAGAVAASKLNIPIVHIEAGLRSFNRKMPEEVNRVVCDHTSTLLFSPTKAGYDNLINEGFANKNKAPFTPDNPGIFHCGDIMYDNSLFFSNITDRKSSILKDIDIQSNEYILATLHRDSNTDVPERLNAIFRSFLTLIRKYKTKIVLPLHPRTKKVLYGPDHEELFKELESEKNMIIIPPVSFLDIIQLEKNAKLVMTDSGGVQKEAYFFNKPCIILRGETEWVEMLDTDKAIIADANYDKIIDSFDALMNEQNLDFPKIFGDGQAAKFILQTILNNS